MLPEEQFISLIALDLHDQIKSLSSNDEFIKGIIKCLKERSTPPLRTALSDWTLDDGIILFKNRVYRAAQFFELQYAELEFITRQVIAELSRGRAGRGWERLGAAVWET